LSHPNINSLESAFASQGTISIQVTFALFCIDRVIDLFTAPRYLCEDLFMFMDELTPIFRELTQQPIAFMGGLFSGIFRLHLADDPVKSWLDQQSGSSAHSSSTSTHHHNGGGPKSISID
jgi:hypothetical protein